MSRYSQPQPGIHININQTTPSSTSFHLQADQRYHPAHCLSLLHHSSFHHDLTLPTSSLHHSYPLYKKKETSAICNPNHSTKNPQQPQAKTQLKGIQQQTNHQPPHLRSQNQLGLSNRITSLFISNQLNVSLKLCPLIWASNSNLGLPNPPFFFTFKKLCHLWQ